MAAGGEKLGRKVTSWRRILPHSTHLPWQMITGITGLQGNESAEEEEGESVKRKRNARRERNAKERRKEKHVDPKIREEIKKDQEMKTLDLGCRWMLKTVDFCWNQ